MDVTWKVISQTEGVLTAIIEYANGDQIKELNVYIGGQDLNVAAKAAIPNIFLGEADSQPKLPVNYPKQSGVTYIFDKGEVLPAHTHHDEMSGHDVYVLEGRAIIRLPDGDHEIGQGGMFSIPVGVEHSVIGVVDGTQTAHRLHKPRVPVMRADGQMPMAQ